MKLRDKNIPFRNGDDVQVPQKENLPTGELAQKQIPYINTQRRLPGAKLVSQSQALQALSHGLLAPLSTPTGCATESYGCGPSIL